MNLNRDFLKTLGGILVIGAIVVATFLYGNRQRQEQIKKEELAKQEQSEQQAQNQNQPQARGGVGGGNLPSSTPQTGGEVFLLAIPAAGVGLAAWRSSQRRFRKTYTY